MDRLLQRIANPCIRAMFFFLNWCSSHSKSCFDESSSTIIFLSCTAFEFIGLHDAWIVVVDR